MAASGPTSFLGWVGLGWVHIRFFGNGGYWFRSYSGSLWKSPKVTKGLLPHHSAPRLGSVCPNAGITPRAAVTGHPWPGTAKPASLPVYPLRNTCVRPAWFYGAPKIKSQRQSQSKAKQSKAKQSKAKQSKAKQSKAKQSKAE